MRVPGRIIGEGRSPMYVTPLGTLSGDRSHRLSGHRLNEWVISVECRRVAI